LVVWPTGVLDPVGRGGPGRSLAPLVPVREDL